MSRRLSAYWVLALALAATTFEARAADLSGTPPPPDERYSDRAPPPEEYYDSEADADVDGERDQRYSQRDEGDDDFYYREERLYERYRADRGWRGDRSEYAPPPPPPYRAEVPPPHRGSLKDQGYGENVPPPPRYEERRQARRDDGCVPQRAIERRLIADGWGDFRNGEPAGKFVRLEARRPSGALYDLTLDRCTGDIVAARLRNGPIYGRYARGPRFYRY